MLNEDGTILCANAEASRILGALGAGAESSRCCEMLGCREGGSVCLTQRAIRDGVGVLDVRRDLTTSTGTHAIWLSVYPLGEGPPRVLLQMRRGDPSDRRRRSDPDWRCSQTLRITTLGHTALAYGGIPFEGDWLDRRPGQLLRFLIANRDRPVTADEIAEGLWRNATYSIIRNVRTCIHRLRNELEPQRCNHEAAKYVVTHGGSYRLNLAMVDIDAEEFEIRVSSGLRCEAADPSRAVRELERALETYAGEFLAELPFAEWALAERARLHDLACKALHTLVGIHRVAENSVAALGALERLSALQPLDETVSRELIESDLREGRGSHAKRRYDRLALMMKRQLGCAPAFTLTELARVQA